MRIEPFVTRDGPITPTIQLWRGTGTNHGKNMLVVAREYIFQRTVIFKYPGKQPVPSSPLSEKRRT